MRVNIYIFLAVAIFVSSQAEAGGQCTATHAFREGRKAGAKELKPITHSLGATSTARGCLEICLGMRSKRARDGKKMFRKMEYSCDYNKKTINKTSQILY